jgi:hypothetical protein
VRNKFGWMAAPEFFLGYLVTAGILFGLHFWWKRQPQPSESAPAEDDYYTAC